MALNIEHTIPSDGIYSPEAGELNLEMFGNNRFFAFLSWLDHQGQESGGCTSDTRLAFSQFKMASKMAAKYRNSIKLRYFRSFAI